MRRAAVALILAQAACGRLAFDERAVDGDPTGLPGEAIEVPPGWSVEVWVDFSSSFTFMPVQYVDDPYEFNNRPHHMFLLPAPFTPGIGLVATWEIFEIRAPDVFIPHGYYPGSDDGPGPDALWDAVFCDAWMAAGPGICVAAGSQNGGDGHYRIAPDWSITPLSSTNNVCDLAYDPAGLFDAVGAPTIYWSGPDGLRRFGEPVFYPGMLNGAFTEILPSGDVLTFHTETTTNRRRLVRVASGTHAELVVREAVGTFEPIARQHAGVYAIVTGDVARFPGAGYAIDAARELLEIDASGAATTIARAGSGWRWTHALVPPASHPLGAAGPAFYLLEFEPATETNRIIRIAPP
jgi:hypothetical protein